MVIVIMLRVVIFQNNITIQKYSHIFIVNGVYLVFLLSQNYNIILNKIKTNLEQTIMLFKRKCL